MAVLVACAVVFIPWKGIWLWVSPLPGTVQAQVDAAGRLFRGGTVVYVDGQKPVLYAAGGKGNLDPEGLFKIASLSKLYIAAAVVKLQQRDSLQLDKTLAEYLPETVGRIENADKITLRMLVQHRSGIPDFIDDPQLPWENLPADPKAYLEWVWDKPADFKPNARYRYSNTNYLLIGQILDQELGYAHPLFIKKEILAPLGLTQTYGELDEVDLDKVVSGYYSGYDGDLRAQNYRVPGGSMVATAKDVGVFLRALNTGAVFTPEEQALYATLYKFEHTGLLPGYSSIARYHKDKDAVVVLFVANSGGGSWSAVEVLYDRIVKIIP